ncbi:MAG: hypothetical protein IT528_09860, partial [Nitrosomonas sp.]|nr:hypothetical protein [Nitrosomonas sp.]
MSESVNPGSQEMIRSGNTALHEGLTSTTHGAPLFQLLKNGHASQHGHHKNDSFR